MSLLQAEVIGEWHLDSTIEMQCVHIALKKSQEMNVTGDFRVERISNDGSVTVVYVKVYRVF